MDKILQKVLNNQKNVSIREFETLLRHFGFYKKRQKGSHATYYNKEKNKYFRFPHQRPIKPCYINNFLNLLNNEI
jgi:predicted RNA binding protein YcfA (HicA-like mRNA interferase family)